MRLDGIPADFHIQMLWGLLFLALVPWAGELIIELGPLSPPGTSVADISPLILNHHMQVWGQPVLNLHPSYQFLVIGLLFSQF